jgi:hypothetical protein
MYDLERKVRYELLAPSLQAKFTSMAATFSKINTIIKEISSNQSVKDAIKKNNDTLETLRELYKSNKIALENKITSVTSGGSGSITGPTERGIFYAYRTVSDGGKLKLNKDKKRLEGDILLHIVVLTTGSISNIQTSSLPNDAMVYNTSTKDIYKIVNGSASIVSKNTDEYNDLVFKVFTRNFVHDPITKKMYYFWSPTVYTRIR